MVNTQSALCGNHEMMCTILWLTHNMCISFIILKYYLFSNYNCLYNYYK
jgi:hypothetical protein